MKIGLVLSGGGAKGAYELGVWKALIELGLDKHIAVFSGTSIGAFNAVLFAQDDISAAECLWNEVSSETLLPISKFKLVRKGVGLAIGGLNMNLSKKILNEKKQQGTVPKDGAIKIIEKYLDINKIKTNNKICYAACTELPDFKVKYFKINDYEDALAKDIILASASLPLIYESTEILDKKYSDGVLTDNTPIQPVYDEGCNLIIIVHLSKNIKVDKSLYPNAQLIEIYPHNLDESIIDGTLNLSDEAKKRRIKEGYNDTIEHLSPIISLSNFISNTNELSLHPILFPLYNWIKKLFE